LHGKLLKSRLFRSLSQLEKVKIKVHASIIVVILRWSEWANLFLILHSVLPIKECVRTSNLLFFALVKLDAITTFVVLREKFWDVSSRFPHSAIPAECTPLPNFEAAISSLFLSVLIVKKFLIKK